MQSIDQLLDNIEIMRKQQFQDKTAIKAAIVGDFIQIFDSLTYRRDNFKTIKA